MQTDLASKCMLHLPSFHNTQTMHSSLTFLNFNCRPPLRKYWCQCNILIHYSVHIWGIHRWRTNLCTPPGFHSTSFNTCVTVLSLLEMHSGGNVRRPRCRPFSQGVLGASDLILIYYWGGLRSAAPMGGAYGRWSLLHSIPTLEGGQCTGARITK